MMAKTQPEISQNWTAISGSDHRLVGRCESATMASAASSVIGFPLSRLWMVMRETPRSLATSVGVPIDSRIALYSAAVMLVGALSFCLRVDGAKNSTLFSAAKEHGLLPAIGHHGLLDAGAKAGQRLVNEVGEIKSFGLGSNHVAGWLRGDTVVLQDGVPLGQRAKWEVDGFSLVVLSGRDADVRCHGLVWFGVRRSQWRRGERKIDLRTLQELSVNYFYAPFRSANT